MKGSDHKLLLPYSKSSHICINECHITLRTVSLVSELACRSGTFGADEKEAPVGVDDFFVYLRMEWRIGSHSVVCIGRRDGGDKNAESHDGGANDGPCADQGSGMGNLDMIELCSG